MIYKSPISVLLKILGLKSGPLTRAFINPVLGAKATIAPFLPANSFLASSYRSLSKVR